LSAAEVDAPRGHLHQGAIYSGVPVLAYPGLALALRPRHERDWSRLNVERVSDDASAFSGDDWAVAYAKRRPVVVVSPKRELRHRNIRVLPMFSYRPDDFLERNRSRIENGEFPQLLHVTENRRVGWEAGVISLTQVIELPTEILTGDYIRGVGQACSLTDASLALMIARLRAYLTLMDRGRP
jgi:hypothetical protein